LNPIHVGERIDDLSDEGADDDDDEDDSEMDDFIVSDDHVEGESDAEAVADSDADLPEAPEPAAAIEASSRATSTKPEASDAHDSSFEPSEADSD